MGFGDLTPSALSDEGSERDFFTVANSLLEMQRSERRRLYARHLKDMQRFIMRWPSDRSRAMRTWRSTGTNAVAAYP